MSAYTEVILSSWRAYQSFTYWNGGRKKRRMALFWTNVCGIVSCIVTHLDMPGKDQHQGRSSPLHRKLFRLPFLRWFSWNNKLLACTMWWTWCYRLQCAIIFFHIIVELKIALQCPVCLCCVHSCFMYYICVYCWIYYRLSPYNI